MNSAAVNMGMYVSPQLLILIILDKYPEVGLFYIVDLNLRNFHTVSHNGFTIFYFPTDDVQGVQLPHILTNTQFFIVVYDSHHNWCEVLSHHSCDRHVPDE